MSDGLTPEERAALNDTRQSYQDRKKKQQAFIRDVAEDEQPDLLETKATLKEGHTVDVSGRLDGELTDKLGRIEDVAEQADKGKSAARISEVADETCQLLADYVDDSAYDKDTFYQVYRATSLEAVGGMLEVVMEALQSEQKRRMGDADGFRQQ